MTTRASAALAPIAAGSAGPTRARRGIDVSLARQRARIVDELTRRQFLGGTAVLLAGVLGGCGGDDSTASTSTPPTRQVAHKYGTTPLAGTPERVVTVGLVDHDAVLALGIVPVALTADDYSDGQPHAVWPWAQDELGDGAPEVLSAVELDLERIAELRPDLILAVYSGITEDEYRTLSEIAPTVAQPTGHDDYQAPWNVMTSLIGDALGMGEAAAELVAGVQDRFDAARRDHPEFEGLAAVYAGAFGDSYYAETEGSARVGILTSLGFTVPGEIRSDQFYMDISREQLDLLDHDVLVWEVGDEATRRAVESDPLYQQLGVHRRGHDVFITDPTLAGSMALISVLSLPFAIDGLTELLAAAFDDA